MPQTLLAATARKLRRFEPARFQVLAGLDGFVDSIIDVVDKRHAPAHYARIETIGLLAKRIGRTAGLSSNLELVVRQTKLGGNGPIMAHALTQAGFKLTYIGCLGQEHIHPVFANLVKRCQAVYSLAGPAATDALEFRDGKLMLGKLQSLGEVTYARLLAVVGLQKLRALWAQAGLVALANWTMLPHQTEIWRGLQKDMARVKVAARSPVLFVDLADPEKRPAQEIATACRLLKNFRRTHRVVLGVNQKESLEVGRALGLKLKAEAIQPNAAALRHALQLDVVVIHPARNAACATEKTTVELDGPYCPNPKLTTGAGDNFNAGFCLGLLAGLDEAELLACGTAASGFYVRHGRSASLLELRRFLEKWAAGKLTAAIGS